jgi:uncharacterized membrane protein YeaQ/YmgE (transglycosylase-associated protein family)
VDERRKAGRRLRTAHVAHADMSNRESRTFRRCNRAPNAGCRVRFARKAAAHDDAGMRTAGITAARRDTAGIRVTPIRGNRGPTSRLPSMYGPPRSTMARLCQRRVLACAAISPARPRAHSIQRQGGIMTVMNFVWMAVVGLIIGALARFFYPGAVPMGFLGTILLGVVGSLFSKGKTGIQPAGLLMSVIGSVLVLWVWLNFMK